MNSNSTRIFKQFLWSHKWAYSISTLSIILSEVVMVQFPNLLGKFTNSLSAGQLTHGVILHYAFWLFVVGVGYVVLYGLGQFQNGQLGRKLEYQLRRRLFTHWESLSTGYYRKRSVGDLLNHAMNDVQAVRESVAGGMNLLTNAIFLLISALVMTCTTVSVKLTFVSMIPILVVPAFVVWCGPRIRNASRKVQEALSRMAELSEESFAAIRLVKATANEHVEGRRFEERVDEIVNRQLSMFKLSAMFQSFVPLMGSLSFAIALLYGGYLTIHHEIRLGSFVAFTLYLAMFVGPLQEVGFVVNNFQRASASLTRLGVLLDEKPEIQDPEQPLDVHHLAGNLEVNLKTFQYPDAELPLLTDIRFTALQGQTLGIVGKTASGKTTLVNLIPRIFDAPPGSIFIDGHDIRNLSLKTVREAVAYVPQDGFLFSTTIAENIGFAKENATHEEVVKAARDAYMYDDIMGFTDGFETVIGERGVTLSGGQRQRTAIARAFLKNAPILIMDDSLSAVDMNTEKNIIAFLTGRLEKQTTIIVSHRLSAVRHADSIIVLDEGRLVEQGTHDELLELDGIYAQMNALQHETEAEEA